MSEDRPPMSFYAIASAAVGVIGLLAATYVIPVHRPLGLICTLLALMLGIAGILEATSARRSGISLAWTGVAVAALTTLYLIARELGTPSSGVQDLWGEALPMWIASLTGLLTLVAAVAAALYARRAANAAEMQAGAARDSLKESRAQAKSARDEAAAAERRQRETPLDAASPALLMQLVNKPVEYRVPGEAWQEVLSFRSFDHVVDREFRVRGDLTITNTSSVAAMIRFTETGSPYPFEGTDEGEWWYLLPKEHRTLPWQRPFHSRDFQTTDMTQQIDQYRVEMEAVVRDIGQNIEDVYRLQTTYFNFFDATPTEIHVLPRPTDPWTVRALIPVGNRSYPRLDDTSRQGTTAPATVAATGP